jgi:hypothetical protein
LLFFDSPITPGTTHHCLLLSLFFHLVH